MAQPESAVRIAAVGDVHMADDLAATAMFAIASSTGARSWFSTVIVSDFESSAAPSLTATVAAAVPASENPGAR